MAMAMDSIKIAAVDAVQSTSTQAVCAGVSGRRTSSRIQKIQKIQSLKAAERMRKREEESEKKKSEQPPKKKRVCNKRNGNGVSKKLMTESAESVKEEVAGDFKLEEKEKAEKVKVVRDVESEQKEEAEGVQVVNSSSERHDGDKSAYSRVMETIRAFYKHFLHYVQEEENRCKKEGEDQKKEDKKKEDKKKGKSKKENHLADGNIKTKSKRPDLKALNEMLTSKEILTTKTRIGSIPGVDVGHQFLSRCEMVTVGCHNHWISGIDYIGASSKKYAGYKLPLTVAIVLSGQYEDDLDNSDDIVYTGQGGNNLLGDKRQIKDQKMERGNLGLLNCMEQKVPVRVIRGHQSKSSYVGKVYTYDGLYKVVNYWAEKGKSGFTVYKFQLKRLEGQPFLTTEQVHFSKGRIPNNVSELRGLVCEDISGGLERFPIPATNLVDDPPVPPTGCTYINRLEISKNVLVPSSSSGCNCKGGCTDARKCACARLNGVGDKADFPYVHRDGGRLIEPKSVVFECGPSCGCGSTCINRTSQRDLRYRLEVFKTPNKGWAVRSWDFIPSGAPVCEYIGVLKKAEDVESNPENNYIFDIDCLQTMKGLGGREERVGKVYMPSLPDIDDKDGGPEFCIDGGTSGNVARYINHSCQPNLFVQCVLSTHHDITQARVVLFAADNIPPLKELTYDYGYEMDSVLGPDGKIKQLACYCGSRDCRKRLF